MSVFGHDHDIYFTFIIHLGHINDVEKTSNMYTKCKKDVRVVMAKIDIVSRCLMRMLNFCAGCKVMDSL